MVPFLLFLKTRLRVCQLYFIEFEYFHNPTTILCAFLLNTIVPRMKLKKNNPPNIAKP